jgi:hypothetical protein
MEGSLDLDVFDRSLKNAELFCVFTTTTPESTGRPISRRPSNLFQ